MSDTNLTEPELSDEISEPLPEPRSEPLPEARTTERSYRELAEAYRAIFNAANTPVLIVDPKSEQILQANTTALELYELEATEIKTCSLRDLSIEHPGEPRLHQRMRGDLRPTFEAVHKSRSGHQILLEIQGSPIQYGDDWAVLMVLRDITERVRVRNELENSLSLLQATIESTADGILVTDGRGGIVTSNSGFRQMWNLPPTLVETTVERELLEHIRRQLVHPDRFIAQVRDLYTTTSGESEDLIECLDGRCFERRSRPRRLAGRDVGRVWCFRDITARRQVETAIRHQAYHDALTNLPNRLLFNDRLEQALGQAKRTRQTLAMLFVDLDRFKSINDTLGHSAGDELLRQVATRLLQRKRDGDTVARLGGDEFVVMINNLRSIDDAPTVALGILESLRTPFVIDDRKVHVSASIGVSLFPYDGTDPEQLIQNADSALYQAKDQGRDTYSLYDSTLDDKSIEKLTLENDLRDALSNHEFLLHYQPQVELAGHRVQAAEALIRWRRENGQLTSPAKFIPIAEDCGMIDGIDRWVLRAACTQGFIWQNRAAEAITLAVNVSAHQFQRIDFADEVAEILESTGFRPDYLELEITERTIMRNPERAVATLRRLRDMGVQIAVDDFGAGHASLSQLRTLPLTTLKIDQTFVRRCNIDRRDGAIVTAIITMAHSLGLRVVAEGVETADQAAFLTEQGCDIVQGFYFSRPLEAPMLTQLLERDATLPGRRFKLA